MSGYLRWLIPLVVLYIMLTGNPEPANWLVGLILGIGVIILLRPAPVPIDLRRVPKAFVAAISFLFTLFVDLIVSGLQVTRLVLQRNPAIEQGIVAIPDATQESWITTASAEAITLTPGELVVEIGDDGTLYTHTLDVDASLAAAEEAQAGRVRQLEELAAW